MKRSSADSLSRKLAIKKKKLHLDTEKTNPESESDKKAKKTNSQKQGFTFFDQPCEDLAQALLGKRLVRQTDDGQMLSGIIVETEAYLGHPDKGAHSYKGKTNKNEAMFMAPGTAYVYHIHSYCCMNISSRGEGAAVLLRALEPVDNIPSMLKLRQKRSPGKPIKDHELCNGPSKLCLSLDITKDPINKEDMTTSTKVWVEEGNSVKPDQIVHCSRINIDYAEEWKDKPLRYYIIGNKCVSKKDKEAEKEMKA